MEPFNRLSDRNQKNQIRVDSGLIPVNLAKEYLLGRKTWKISAMNVGQEGGTVRT